MDKINCFINQYSKNNKARKYEPSKKIKMIREIANTLKERLLHDGGSAYLESVSGLVQTVSYKTTDENGNPATKRLPVSYDTNIEPGCAISPERALTPDSSKRGIFYLEANGAVVPVRELSKGRAMMRCNLVGVVWLNRRLLSGEDYTDVNSLIYADIVNRLRHGKHESPDLYRIKVDVGGFRQDPSIFARYSYEEEVLQYLRPPFEYFAIDITVNFIIQKSCIAPLVLTPNNC